MEPKIGLKKLKVIKLKVLKISGRMPLERGIPTVAFTGQDATAAARGYTKRGGSSTFLPLPLIQTLSHMPLT